MSHQDPRSFGGAEATDSRLGHCSAGLDTQRDEVPRAGCPQGGGPQGQTPSGAKSQGPGTLRAGIHELDTHRGEIPGAKPL